MKGWRPEIDLETLCAALGEEILAATNEEVRALSTEQGRAFSAAVRDVRTVIAASDQDEPDPDLLALNAALCDGRCARQH